MATAVTAANRGLVFDRPGTSAGLSIFEPGAIDQLTPEELKLAISRMSTKAAWESGPTGDRHDSNYSDGFEVASRNQKYLQMLQERQNKIEAESKAAEERQRIMDIYGGGGGGGGQSLDAALQQSADAQRKALEDTYAAEEGMGARTLTDYLGKQRKNTIEEASAGGGGGRRGYLTQVLADLDAQAGNSMSDYIAKLRAGKGQARVGLEEGLQGRMLQGRGQDISRSQGLASLIQGGGQFQQGFGLEQDKFGYAKGRDSLSDIMDRQAMAEARELGRLQAEASKPTGWQKFGQVAGGVGSLIGGIGGLAGGIGALRKAK